MKTDIRPEHVVSLSIGVLVAIALNRVTGWWLDSGSGVGATLAAQFVAALLVAVWRRRGRNERAISFWMGSLAGMAMLLFEAGPGTIWPLVLIIAGVVTAAPVLAGVAVASMLK